MRKQLVPVGLFLVAAEHLGHCVVDALDAAIDSGVVRAGADLVDAKAFADGVGELRGKLLPIVRDEGDGRPP